MNRRNFVKVIGGVSASLFLDPFHCLAKYMKGFKRSDHSLTSDNEDTRVIAEPWERPIFAQFENQALMLALEKYADETDRCIICGKPFFPDVAALSHSVLIIDRDTIDPSDWDQYVDVYLEDTRDDIPCIIIDNRKDLKVPDIKRPSPKKVLFCGAEDRRSISQIIATAEKIRLERKEEFQNRLNNEERLESDLESLRLKYLGCVKDGIIDYFFLRELGLRILWVLNEVYRGDEVGLDLRKALRPPLTESFDNLGREYASLVAVSFGILNHIPPDSIDYEDYKELAFVLEDIAVICINKLTPASWSYQANLQKAFNQFKDHILRQVELIDPHIIIGEDTLWLFHDILQLTEPEIIKSCEYVYSFEKKDRLWININNPAVFQTSPGKYYPEIMKGLKRWMDV